MEVVECNKFILKKELLKMSTSSKEKGQGLIEYLLILVLVAVVVVAVVQIFGAVIGSESLRYIPRFFAYNWKWGGVLVLFWLVDYSVRMTIDKLNHRCRS